MSDALDELDRALGVAQGGFGFAREAQPASNVEPFPREEGRLLDELNFSDLYICIDIEVAGREPSRYRMGPNADGKTGTFRVPPEFEGQINLIRTQIGNSERDDGTLNHDSMRLRYSRARVIDGIRYASVRRIPHEIPDLEGLDLNPEAVEVIRGWARRRGIVLIGGATGAGKTTTAAAIIKDWLVTSGGTAVAIEDPPEYRLQGEISERSACYQLEVQSDDDWADAIKTALRWRPKIIFLGEIRTVAAARQALRASTSGHLVLTTVHGGAVDETVEALLRLAEADMGEGAKTILADNLIGVIHQKLGRFGPDVDILDISTKEKRGDGARAMISKGSTEKLNDAQFKKQYLAPRPSGR